MWEIDHPNFRPDQDQPFKQIKSLAQILIHPKYDFKTVYFDVALLKMDSDAQYTTGVLLICLPKNSVSNIDSRYSDTVHLIGWGSNTVQDGPSPYLKYTSLTIYSQNYCNNAYDLQGGLNVGSKIKDVLPDLFKPEVFCAGHSVSYFK